ncbi:selenide, water dikinase [Besnoitia besnoiti]|uniref:Selenide, water dikinase n=1 Tax=Besnoitia besnoiti TaxID=94643 RepID=A0A2A9MIH6_BESBE|nr:selenide, water dikinase [Besnoitia besnoiti]PFH36061.1 selenide, water dikinase [Besnoitia besnoiti]
MNLFKGKAAGGACQTIAQDLVLIGGGHAHIFLLKQWEERPVRRVRLTLVAPEIDTPYSPMVPGFVSGAYSWDQCQVDLVRLCQKANARFVRASAIGVDREKQVIFCDDGRPPLRYDILSIDTGSAPTVPVSVEADSVEGAAAPLSPFPAGVAPVKPVEQFCERWQAALKRIEAAAAAAWSRELCAPPGSAAEGEKRLENDAESQAPQQDGEAGETRADAVACRVFNVVLVGAGAVAVELAFAMQVAVQAKLELMKAEAALEVKKEDNSEACEQVRQQRASQDKLFRVDFHILAKSETLLPECAPAIQKRVARLLDERGIATHLNCEASSVAVQRAAVADSEQNAENLEEDGGKAVAGAEKTQKAVTCADGRVFAFDECFWCCDAAPQPWLVNTGLELTLDGFLAVDSTLRSVNTPNVFAAGDVAEIVGAPAPKPGAFSARAGPPLNTNLRRVLADGEGARLSAWTPAKLEVPFIDCGNGYAVGLKGGIAFEGALAWNVKSREDLAWMNSLQEDLSPPSAPPSAAPSKAPSASLSKASIGSSGGSQSWLGRFFSAGGSRAATSAVARKESQTGGATPSPPPKGSLLALLSRVKDDAKSAEKPEEEDEKMSKACELLLQYVREQKQAAEKANTKAGCKGGAGAASGGRAPAPKRRCGGCGAKVPSTVLRHAMQELQRDDAFQNRQHELLLQRLRGEKAADQPAGLEGPLALKSFRDLSLPALQQRIDREGGFFPPLFSRKEVLLGLEDADDGCIFAARPLNSQLDHDDGKEPEPLLVQTVDFFKVFYDDSFVMGRIAATHALSDCYAMGAEPLVALLTAVVPYSSESVMANNLLQLLGGCCSVLARENCQLAGGHSAQGRDACAGLTVTGRLAFRKLTEKPVEGASEGSGKPKAASRKAKKAATSADGGEGAEAQAAEAEDGEGKAPETSVDAEELERAAFLASPRCLDGLRYLSKGTALAKGGDVLILTKPLGIGFIMAGHMEGKARGRWVMGALDLMQVSNRAAAEIFMDFGAVACTDITGFGVLGHLLEMLRACRKDRVKAMEMVAARRAEVAAGPKACENQPEGTETSEADASSSSSTACNGKFQSLVCARLSLSSLPVLEGAAELMELGVHSSLFPYNARYFDAVSLKTMDTADASDSAAAAQAVPAVLPAKLPLIFDPQTSGGLLAAVPADRAEECVRRLREEGGYPSAVAIGSLFERQTFVPCTQKGASQATQPWENVVAAVECLF